MTPNTFFKELAQSDTTLAEVKPMACLCCKFFKNHVCNKRLLTKQDIKQYCMPRLKQYRFFLKEENA